LKLGPTYVQFTYCAYPLSESQRASVYSPVETHHARSTFYRRAFDPESAIVDNKLLHCA